MNNLDIIGPANYCLPPISTYAIFSIQTTYLKHYFCPWKNLCIPAKTLLEQMSLSDL